jgi:outer membrane protein TolC
MYMKRQILALLLLTAGAGIKAQAPAADPIAPILRQIEQNNRRLQSAREALKADVLEIKSTNNLDNPEVNYAHLFNSDRTSQQQSELTVVQGFDFPTVYAVRSKANKLEANTAESNYMVERREVLLEAKLLCLDLIGLNREANLLHLLQHHADSLARLCDSRLQAGDASALEANRAKLDLMTIRTELADNAAAHRAALQQLLAMNANVYIDQMVIDAYPTTPTLPDYETLRDELLPQNKQLLQADAATRAAQKQVTVDKQGWLPRLQLGYRRNTAPTEQFNGFVVGGSLPLFANRGKVRASQARALSAELAKEDAALTAEATLQALYNEAHSLREAMTAYDLPLMQQSFTLLGKALAGGQLTWHEYFVEMEALVRRGQSYIQLENRYQKVVAALYADKL